MKKSVSGKTSAILLLSLCFWAVNAQALPTRKMWYFDHFAQGPEPTGKGLGHNQVSFSALNYSDAMSTKVAAVADLRYFEIELTGAQRLFFGMTPEGAALRDSLSLEHQSVGIEIGRFAVTNKGAHGRLAAGLFLSRPSGTSYWKLGMQTGVLPTASLPWDFRLSSTAFLSFNLSNDFFLMTMESARRFSLGNSSLNVGGFFTWGQAIRSSAPTGENMLLAMGPSASYDGGFGKLEISLPIRVWVDRETIGGGVGYLSDFSPPAFSLAWTLMI